MLVSMTGYGRGCVQSGDLTVEVEARSVNHRYSNINIKMPRQLNALEGRVRRFIGERFSRGRLDIFIGLSYRQEGKTLVPDFSLGMQYVEALRQLKEKLGLAGEVTLEMLARNNSLFEIKEVEGGEELWPVLEGALRESIDNLNLMRSGEGKALAADVLMRCRGLEERILALEPRLETLPNVYEERMRSRLAETFPEVNMSDERLLQEVALCASRCDVTEEVVRFKSHLAQFCNWIEAERFPVGKKLDFLVQEINRELNTMCSKISDSRTVQALVEMKSELEKIREQIQNIE